MRASMYGNWMSEYGVATLFDLNIDPASKVRDVPRAALNA
ncbi:MAG: hypothetical protein JWL62_1914 [Hyphomicrobiales bacterium]|nr:hypothetical protein [Hyphomicrobiales bacterium]